MDENKDKEIDFDIVRSNFDDFTDIIKQRFISIKMLNKLWENRINHCNNKAPKQEYSDKCIFNCKLVLWMLIKFLMKYTEKTIIVKLSENYFPNEILVFTNL